MWQMLEVIPYDSHGGYFWHTKNDNCGAFVPFIVCYRVFKQVLDEIFGAKVLSCRLISWDLVSI